MEVYREQFQERRPEVLGRAEEPPCFFFSKDGKVQHLIHELKYKGNNEAGVFLGQQLGETLKHAPLFQGIDYLIPVPLHPKREKQRGYNQSLMICQGIQEVMGIPIGDKYLVRAVYTETQTHKAAAFGDPISGFSC